MRDSIYRYLLPANLLIMIIPGALYAASPATEYAPATAYGSVPKGVVLEGCLKGFKSLKTVTYDMKKNCFLIDKEEKYANPVSREEMACILRAIHADTRLGVSIVLNERLITYGGITPEQSISRKLYSTDMFLISIVFGWRERLTNMSLPGNYRPEKPALRRCRTVCFATFDNYSVKKNAGNYRRKECRLNLTLVPMARGRAPDGGYLPDMEAAQRNEFEATDKRNRAHVLQHMDEYLRIPVVARAAAIGEAAAFARSLHLAGIDLESLAGTLHKPYTRKAATTVPAAVTRAIPLRRRPAEAGKAPASRAKTERKSRFALLRKMGQGLKKKGGGACQRLSSLLRRIVRKEEADTQRVSIPENEVLALSVPD